MTLQLPLAATGVPGLSLLPAGPVPENPAALLGAGRLRALLDRLLDTADVVLLDVPPLVAVADGALIAVHTDGVLLVASAGRTRRDQLARARGMLDNVGATVLGVALIGGDGEVTAGDY
jgi:Mrp family chromosome partitioning ATPase